MDFPHGPSPSSALHAADSTMSVAGKLQNSIIRPSPPAGMPPTLSDIAVHILSHTTSDHFFLHHCWLPISLQSPFFSHVSRREYCHSHLHPDSLCSTDHAIHFPPSLLPSSPTATSPCSAAFAHFHGHHLANLPHHHYLAEQHRTINSSLPLPVIAIHPPPPSSAIAMKSLPSSARRRHVHRSCRPSTHLLPHLLLTFPISTFSRGPLSSSLAHHPLLLAIILFPAER